MWSRMNSMKSKVFTDPCMALNAIYPSMPSAATMLHCLLCLKGGWKTACSPAGACPYCQNKVQSSLLVLLTQMHMSARRCDWMSLCQHVCSSLLRLDAALQRRLYVWFVSLSSWLTLDFESTRFSAMTSHSCILQRCMLGDLAIRDTNLATWRELIFGWQPLGTPSSCLVCP